MSTLNQVIANWFSGRLNRRNYFLGGVLWYLFSPLLLAPSTLSTMGFIPYNSLFQTLLLIFDVIALIVIFLFPIGTTIRRFHDRNKSEWTCLWMLIPIVNLIFLIELLLAPSEEPNKYGETNKGWSLKQVVGL